MNSIKVQNREFKKVNRPVRRQLFPPWTKSVPSDETTAKADEEQAKEETLSLIHI